jgi:hypothetical protein
MEQWNCKFDSSFIDQPHNAVSGGEMTEPS